MTEKSRFRLAAIVVVFSWIAVFVFLPNLGVLLTGLMTRDEIRLVIPRFTFDNFRNLMDPVFLHVFTRSFRYAATATVLCLALSYPFAYLLARTLRRWRNYLLILVIVPFWTSSLVRTYALIILMKANGLINQGLQFLGLIETPLSMLYTETAVVAGMVYTLMPFMILPIYASAEKLDRRLVEAARDLGAGTIQVFLRVVLPLTLPGVIAGCILVFLPALGLFYIPDLLGGAKTMLVGNYIKNQFLTARDWPMGAAASIFLTAVMGMLLLVYYRTLKRYDASVME